ncbi:hypothetical protein BGZ52_005658 [Haplosporangium bisporale]|nr:hypothetical protein BGZ52_005658 [Haplosporangium bisporale]
MFLPLSFFTLNLFFLTLEISVAAALAAVLAHTSRRYGGYAQSIRWIKQAGYWEMIVALYFSVRKGARRPLWALLATLFWSIVLTGIIIGGKFYITPSTGERSPSREVATSTQFLAFSAWMTSLAAWSFPVQYDTNIGDTLARALNSSKVNPRASPTKRYQPRVSDYEVACDRLNVRVFNGSLFLPNDGCATFDIYPPISFNVNTTTSYILQTSKGRAKAVLPSRTEVNSTTPGMLSDIPLFTRVKYEDQYYCSTINTLFSFFNVTRVAFTVSPSTVLTKCQLLSGHMVSLSTTAIRFAVPNRQMFHSIATSIFGDQDELVSAMHESVNNGTLTDFLADELERMVVMEVKIVGTQATALICVGSKQPGSVVAQINCAYTIANTLITKPRPLNPDIAQIVSNKNLSTDFPMAGVMMTLTHLPLVSESTSSYALSKIFNASAVAVTYLANLGQNVIMDWDSSTMYIAYDTVDLVEGYDVPGCVFFLMCAAMIVCFLFWATTEWCVEDRYTRSLYWLVSKSLAPTKGNGHPPLLYPFDPETLEFDGRRIVSTKDLRDSEKETAVYEQSIHGSQDPLVAEACAINCSHSLQLQ